MKKHLTCAISAVLYILISFQVTASHNIPGNISASTSDLPATKVCIAPFRWNRPLSEQWLETIISKKFSFSENLESAPNYHKVEVVSSAYYRPLKKQKKFARGNYQKDVQMNGKGIATFTGTRPKIGTIAADFSLFRPGTVLDIPGYGYGIVEDIGKAIKGRRIDLFMGEGEEACERAIEWGKKKIEVRVVYQS